MNKLEWIFNQNTKPFIHKIASENIVCEMAAIFSGGDELKRQLIDRIVNLFVVSDLIQWRNYMYTIRHLFTQWISKTYKKIFMVPILENFRRYRSMLLLLVPRLPASPGHQQPLYSLCRINALIIENIYNYTYTSFNLLWPRYAIKQQALPWTNELPQLRHCHYLPSHTCCTADGVARLPLAMNIIRFYNEYRLRVYTCNFEWLTYNTLMDETIKLYTMAMQ